MSSPDKRLVVGRIGSAFGIKGWVKVHSDTSPAENLFDYSPWTLNSNGRLQEVELVGFKAHGKGYIAQLKGIDDRTQAELLVRATIEVPAEQLPGLEDGEFYWHQLQGLRVRSVHEGHSVELGDVVDLMETGANDVMVVKDSAGTERLIPYVPGQYVLNIDVGDGVITVDWDPEF